MTTRHIAGLAVWLVVVCLLVVGAAAQARLGRPLYWSIGLLFGVALLSALSALWSGSVELSLIEADRVLVYLGILVATFLIAQTDQRSERFAEGLAIACAGIAVLALASRLLPELLDVSNPGDGPRLRYPLGYWNANGLMFGMGIALLLWANRRAALPALRWVAAGAIPAMLVALYFTYSRGGLLALAIAAGVTIALSRDRLWMLATLAAGALGALPALLAIQDRRELADNLAGQATIDQGVTVTLILLAGTALSVVLFAALRWAELRGGRLTGRAVELSRNPAVLRGAAAVFAVVGIAAAIVVGGRAWDQFSETDIQFPDRPESHFSDLGGAGRHDFWRVAVDSFAEDPLLGVGAGTYEFAWERDRTIELPLHDAHSLYLESFAELGLVGGLLVLGLVGGLLWWAFSAWRAAPHPQREVLAVMLAVMLAFAVGAALDWFWELAALGAVFFICAGVAVAARCAQLSPAPVPVDQDVGGKWGVATTGIALAWVTAILLVGPLLVERELETSRDVAETDIASAIEHADRARSIEPWAASPYVELGLLAELQGDYERAAEHFSDAIDREDENWQWYYLRARVERQAGAESAARADLERARELNPLAECLRTGEPCG